MPLRVWIVNHYADPPDGLATRSFDLARRMVERGNPTTIFVSNFSHYRFRRLRALASWQLWRRELIDGVQFIWIRTPGYRGNDWRRILNMLTFSALVLVAGVLTWPPPAVVIGVSVHPFAALAGFVIARLRGARFFFEETDLWPQTLIEFGRLREGSLMARLLTTIERFLYRRAERIVMLWRHTDQHVEAQGGSSARILWVPHGVELSRYQALEPYMGGPERPFRIMFLGGFVMSNAVDVILDAARVLADRHREDVRFLLVGSGAERQNLIRRAEEFHLNNVDFPPAVPKNEITRAMNQADAFIYGLRDLPLYRYGISLNKLTDYLAAGRPIIFFGRSTYDPVAEARAGFSIPPGDPAGIADAIERLVALSPQERIDMGRRGHEYLAKHHNIPRLAERLLTAMETSPT
jgi:glycosyltransferase involved in cell wall biosynthesis